MNDGLKDKHRKTLIDILSANPKVERVVLFGSRAMGTHSAESDIDLALYGDGLTLDDLARLKERIEETTIPQQVDLVLVKDIDNDRLRGHIERHGVEWFVRIQSVNSCDCTKGDWTLLPFTEAVEVNPSVPLKRGKIYPFVDMKAVESSRRGASESEFREFKSGGARFMPFDTLMARITPCLENGKIARYIPSEGVDGPAFGSTEFIVIRGRKGITDNDYAYYLTKWEEFRQFAVSQMTGSSGRQRVPADSLAKFLAPVPESLSEQRAIAHILGTLDDKIELNRQMNRTLEAMAQALFKSWFIDFDPVVVNALRAGNPVPEKFAQRACLRRSFGRQAAHYRDNPRALSLPEDTLRLFPDRFQDSELGPIPEGWNATTIGAEFDLTMGQSPPGSTYNEKSEGLPFFQGRRDFGFRYPSNRVYCNAPTRIAHPGDTLVSVRAPVGDINMAHETCCIGRGVAAIRHKSGSRSYTYYAMKALGEQFKRFEAEGTVFGSINKKQFHNLPSIGVTPDIVAEFEKLASPIDENIQSLDEEMRTLSKLRDTLLPKLISGELRLSAAALETLAAQAGVPDAEKLLEDAL